MTSRAYFGDIQEIQEIDYVLFKVPLFKCKWVGNNIGVQTGDLGFTRVDLGKATYMTEPFIMASQKNTYFMSLILLTKDSQLFSKKNTLLVVMKIKIEILILLRLLLTQHMCLIHMKTLIQMMCMIFVMIMKKAYGKINKQIFFIVYT